MERIGRYRVIRPLGQGGMGAVFLAHDPTLERDVALKLLHHEPTRSGLRDEAVALAALSHPGIVTVFEIGEHDGQDFIAMEYLPGRSLREVLQSGAMPRVALLAICAKVALALEAAHRAGILHRDIKPENVVVATSGEIKVVDFGLARRLEHAAPARSARPATASEVVAAFRRTLPPETLLGGADTDVSAGTQTMFGTPAYMAPEVLLGEPSTAASDVFGLGITIYECLAGRRPYTATSLVEVIAQTIDGPPPRLEDPLGALVDRMLARDPAQRPALAEVARGLQRPATAPVAPPPPHQRRAPIVLAAVLGSGALGLGGWWLARRAAPAAVAPAAAPPFVSAALAIAPFTLAVPNYGVEPPSATAVADVLARLVGEVGGARLVGLTVTTADPEAARALGAKYLVRGAIAEDGTVLRARLELVALATSATTPLPAIERPELAPLLDAIAAEVAHAIAPAAVLDTAPNRMRAQLFAQLGKPVLEGGRFTEARPYFEQAVDADPTLFDGWYALALVLGWMDAPEERVRDAAGRAMALAPPGPERELIRGVGRFLAGDFAGARAVLEPLDRPPAFASRELLYYLGEASWHDGRHAAAAAYFARTLQLDRAFRPATVHAWQYAVVRRDAKQALYYVGLAGESHEWIDLAAGHYAELARTGSPPRKLDAELVLGQLDAPEVAARLAADDLDGATYRVAVALAEHDPARARAAFATAWAKVAANRDPGALPGILYSLEGLGEVVISAELPEETRQVVAYLAAHSADRPARGYPRLAILAAGATGDRALIVRDHGTERTGALATAITAELAGDRGAAARQLQALVDDPTFTFDYPERAALLRNLAALHDRKRIAALCADTLRPPIVRPALLVLRDRCAHRP